MAITFLRLLFAALHGLEASWGILGSSADSNAQDCKVASMGWRHYLQSRRTQFSSLVRLLDIFSVYSVYHLLKWMGDT